jgi:hypothetical protein
LIQANTPFDLDKTIVDLDIRESGIRFGKRSFINCEVTLFLDTKSVTSDKMKMMLDGLTNEIIYLILKQIKILNSLKRNNIIKIF